MRGLASFFFRKPSRILREVNANAQMVQWTRDPAHRTDNLFPDRFALYEYVNGQTLNGGPVDYLEFGVYRGESLVPWTRLNPHRESRFYGFDTFTGLPEDWDQVRGGLTKGHFDAGGRPPEVDDPRVEWVQGAFQDTLPGFLQRFEPRHPLVVNNDSDLYTSTLYCLTQLDRILVPGSVIIFDEFFVASHEFQAFFDWTSAYRRECRVVGAVGTDPYVHVAVQLT